MSTPIRNPPTLGDTEDMTGKLRRLPVLASLPHAVLSQVAADGRFADYRDGQTIHAPKNEDFLWIVLWGSVSLVLVSADGRELALGERAVGELFELTAEESRPGWEPGALVGAGGRNGAIVFCLPAVQLVHAVSTDPQSAEQLFKALRHESRRREELIGELAFHKVATSVARIVGRLAQEDSRHIVRETHQQLASKAGTSREEVSRALGVLEKKELIHRCGRRLIAVPDPERLLHEHTSKR